MSEDEEVTFRKKMKQRRDSVSTREELSEYADFLADGYQKGFFEEQPVSEYVGGVAGVVDGLEGIYMNRSQKMPEEPTWNMMAIILTAAFAHS